jgi:hypothetical protein
MSRHAAPVPGRPNLHVALANALKLSTQFSDAQLIDEVERLVGIERSTVSEVECPSCGATVRGRMAL